MSRFELMRADFVPACECGAGGFNALIFFDPTRAGRAMCVRCGCVVVCVAACVVCACAMPRRLPRSQTNLAIAWLGGGLRAHNGAQGFIFLFFIGFSGCDWKNENPRATPPGGYAGTTSSPGRLVTLYIPPTPPRPAPTRCEGSDLTEVVVGLTRRDIQLTDGS